MPITSGFSYSAYRFAVIGICLLLALLMFLWIERTRFGAIIRASAEKPEMVDVLGIDPRRIVLTASTSEAYGVLFKLLCDPGDEVLVPEPSYPLFEHLARFEGVRPVSYRLVHDGAWHLDFDSIRAARTPRTRALVVVHPNNPTGSYVKRAELREIENLGANPPQFATFSTRGIGGPSFACDGSNRWATSVFSRTARTYPDGSYSTRDSKGPSDCTAATASPSIVPRIRRAASLTVSTNKNRFPSGRKCGKNGQRISAPSAERN